ncbi:MAG: NAD(P)/FAD-dependent oxidoreductase [Candidatus Palauibacterales bacterium]|nr:NAD(P)/FAD-dependent oxidoreductase [Candidatus Palauibacterales bacterium]
MVSTLQSPITRDRYDVIIAGARCAGASTAMLLARRGLRVLVVDPASRGSDTLSTHALMRGGVLQLHRWGLLDAIRSAETPALRKTTFHYGDESIEVEIKALDGVDALYAPRRTLLDSVLVDAALAAGAEVVHGHRVVDLIGAPGDRIRGAKIAGADRRVIDVAADLVIGADGVHSRVARILEADHEYTTSHTAASIYGYRKGLGLAGYHWFYIVGASVGSIPTNDGDTCVFILLPPTRFENDRHQGLEALYHKLLSEVSPALASEVASSEGSGKLRAFAGATGFLRRSAGPGWALVGDAGYFKDPITAHGITDALRDAELLARAVVEGGDDALAGYQATRDDLVKGLLDVTDRISSFEWDLDEVKEHHFTLSREMKAEVDLLRTLDQEFVAPPAVVPPTTR